MTAITIKKIAVGLLQNSKPTIAVIDHRSWDLHLYGNAATHVGASGPDPARAVCVKGAGAFSSTSADDFLIDAAVILEAKLNKHGVDAKLIH